MYRLFSLRCTAIVLAVLGLFALSAPRAAATDRPFHVEGTFTFVAKGNNADVSGSGHAEPGGPFVFEDSVRGRDEHGVKMVEGTVTLVFASGSTLSFYYEAPIDENNVVMGPYWVIGGTGRFEGASGYGTIWYPIGQGETFTMDGELE